MLGAIAKGESDPKALAALASSHVHASQEVLQDALTGKVREVHRQVLRFELERVTHVERQILELDQALERLTLPFAVQQRPRRLRPQSRM